jgi:hypothetical protein
MKGEIVTALRPFFSFYGSKWRLALKYPAPTYKTIVEPFAGSAGYSLRYPDRQVILVDRDPIIAAVWRWLIAASPEDILSLPRLRAGESLDDYDLPQEAKWLMGFWVNRASAMPKKTVTKYAMQCDMISTYVNRCASQVNSIRHWRIIDGGYQESPPHLIASWFVDPPYQKMGRYYRYGSAGLNYNDLCDWCYTRSGQVIVCENAGANWLPFKSFSDQQGITCNGDVRYSKEMIWISSDELRMAA